MDEKVTETQEVTTVTQEPARVVKTTKQVTPPVQGEHPQKAFQKKKAIFRAYQVIWYILGVIEILLGFRMTLMALGASPQSGFTSLVYTLSDPLALPFRGIFGITVVPGERSIFEWSTLVAAAVYALIAFGLVELFQLIKPVSQQEVEETIDTQ
jgi:uncharacterized protein YggT (Ycf19 family)